MVFASVFKSHINKFLTRAICTHKRPIISYNILWHYYVKMFTKIILIIYTKKHDNIGYIKLLKIFETDTLKSNGQEMRTNNKDINRRYNDKFSTLT